MLVFMLLALLVHVGLMAVGDVRLVKLLVEAQQPPSVGVSIVTISVILVNAEVFSPALVGGFAPAEIGALIGVAAKDGVDRDPTPVGSFEDWPGGNRSHPK
jgi:hypothetical protein